MLKEQKKFELLSYLLHLNNLDEGIKSSTLISETFHNHKEIKITAGLKNKHFKKMKVQVSNSSELEKFSSVAITSDEKGSNILQNIFDKDIKDNKSDIEIFSNSCYVHYPFRQSKIICFGENSCYKLGNKKNTESTETPEIVPDHYTDIVEIKSYKNFTCFLTKDGKLFRVGEKRSWGTMSDITRFGDDKKVKNLYVGQKNIAILDEDNKIWIEGRNMSYNIDDESGDKNNLFEKKMPDENDKPVSIGVGRHYHFVITESGKLYGAGNYFLKDIKLECGVKYERIELPEGAKCIKAVGNCTKKPCAAFILLEFEDRNEIWSASGANSKGILGQGDNVKKSEQFQKMSYDSKNIKFVDIDVKTDHALAITDKGELYGWGCNIYNRMGIKEQGDKLEPT